MTATLPSTATPTMNLSLREGLMEMTKSAQNKGTDPLIWGVQLSSSLLSAGITMPSTEVAELLVSHICWTNNLPIAWKYLEKALTLRIAPPMLVLALLSNRFYLNLCNLTVLEYEYEQLCIRWCIGMNSPPEYGVALSSIDATSSYRSLAKASIKTIIKRKLKHN